MKPHELAAHVAAVFPLIPHTDLQPVRLAMEHAVSLLVTHQKVVEDLSDPDVGIPFALMVEGQDCPQNIKAAAALLRMCLNAIERGATTPNDHRHIPLLLASLAGYVPDMNARAARRKRPNRGKADALDRGIDEAVRGDPDATWKMLAKTLEWNGVIIDWMGDRAIFKEGETEQSISSKMLQHRITAAKKRRRK